MTLPGLGRWFLGLPVAVAAALGCGSGAKPPGEIDPPPDAQRSMDASPDTAPGFSDATRAEFHLVFDGQLSDGRTRVLYAPRVAWLERSGANPQPNPQLTKAEASGAMILNGHFSLTTPTPGTATLAREASAANVALVRADLGMAHVICGSTTVLSTLQLGDCNKPATRVDLPSGVAFSASANAAAATETAARITAHLADGSAWDDVLAGYIAWQPPGGDVLRTTLEVDCVGGFGSTGNAIVADTAACKARYQP